MPSLNTYLKINAPIVQGTGHKFPKLIMQVRVLLGVQKNIASVVQWIEQGSSKPKMRVRILPEAQTHLWRNWIAQLITNQ